MTGAVTYSGRRIERDEGESVLDALLRAGEPIPHSCKAGACQSCLMEAVEGAPGPEAQAGLKPAYVARNYFLACCSRPDSDIAVRLPDAGASACDAVLAARRMLSDDVAAIRLKIAAGPGEFRPGQYVTLSRPDDGVARSYSIANLPDEDGTLELHVRRIPGGAMSPWLHTAPLGQRLRVRGPAGDCFYLPDAGAPDFPILLAGTGTGLAPLLGVLRDALRHGHSGPIRLFHGGRTPGGLYLLDELRRLAARYDNLHCHFSALELTTEAPGVAAGGIVDHVGAILPSLDLKRTQAFFCGAPDLVAQLKKKAFLAGVGSKAIHADPFLPSVARSVAA